jgi:tetratricopeptide (TPR) repeat protein
LYENIAELFFAKEDYVNSIIYYEKFFKNSNNLNVSDKWGLKKFAVSCFNNGYLEKAEELIDKALDIDSRQKTNDWEIYHDAGIIKMKLSKIEESMQYFIKAIGLNEKDTESYLNLARMLINIEEFGKANEVLESEPGIRNGNPSEEVLYLNSEVLFKMGDFSKAVDELFALLFLNENDEVYCRLGLCFIKLKDFNEAAYHFSKAIDFNNQNPSYFTYLGDCFTEIENYEDANLAYNCALLLDQGYIHAIAGKKAIEILKYGKI